MSLCPLFLRMRYEYILYSKINLHLKSFFKEYAWQINDLRYVRNNLKHIAKNYGTSRYVKLLTKMDFVKILPENLR